MTTPDLVTLSTIRTQLNDLYRLLTEESIQVNAFFREDLTSTCVRRWRKVANGFTERAVLPIAPHSWSPLASFRSLISVVAGGAIINRLTRISLR